MTSFSRFLTIVTLVAFAPGCAAQHKSAPAPYDMAEAGMAAPAMDAEMALDDMRGEMAAPAPSGSAAPSAAPSPGLTTTTPSVAATGVLGMVPASKGEAAGDAEPAIATDPQADPETIGDDSVERLIVFTGAMGLLVDNGTAPAMIDSAADMAVAAGGYVAQQTDTSLQLRVPSKRFRLVMRHVQQLGQLQSRSVQTLDVTEEFHDLGVRLKNLQATRDRIQVLLKQAKGLEEILRIEQELQRVSGQIDQLEGRLRYLGSHSAFSTINVAFSERAPEVKMVEEEHIEEEPPPPPPPPPPRTLDTPIEWIDGVGVHHLMRLD